MKGIEVTGGGGPEVLRYGDLPDPTLAPGEALVKVDAAGVNFLDIYRRRAGLGPVPGMEGAGTVARLDDEGRALGLAEGDRVAWVMQPGSYAELAAVPVRSLVPVPDPIDPRTAAAAMLQGLTAGYLIEESYPVASGEVILVHAASGGVGLLLCQLAVARGARVLGTVSSAEKAALAAGAGAEATIRYDEVDFADTVGELTGGRGVDAVFDAVNRETFHGSLRSLRCRGTLVLYGEASGQVDPISPKLLQEAASVKLTYPSLAHFVADRDELLGRAGRLFGLLEDGSLRLETTTYPLAEAARAHGDLESRRTSGKVVLQT